MPQFALKTPAKPHTFYDLDTFAKGYVEAMFFTNGDTGDDRENLLNEWGVECLTAEAVASIKADCDKFRVGVAGDVLDRLYSDGEVRNGDGYDEEQAGRDFWFTRQGHGVGYWDRDLGPDGDTLSELAVAFGEAYVEAYRHKIYHR